MDEDIKKISEFLKNANDYLLVKKALVYVETYIKNKQNNKAIPYENNIK